MPASAWPRMRCCMVGSVEPRCVGGEVGPRELAHKEVVQATNEKIDVVRAHLKAAQDRQKLYADKRRRLIEFQVGDMVLLKVSPWKGVIRFRKRGKLSPWFIGPFKIIERVGKVAYHLKLPEELSGIHGTFHVSQLHKCLAEETAYIHYDDIEVDNSLNYAVKPIAILDRKVKSLRNKVINQVKVKWEHRKGSDTTWESEEEMQRLYPTLFGKENPSFLSTSIGLEEDLGYPEWAVKGAANSICRAGTPPPTPLPIGKVKGAGMAYRFGEEDD
ncbi:uncharacterized protein LOC110942885 [Helianthus annuus]|uniref:uncharacterized protein LOC110942885 n=1 Tax=Helianthus annuus TaxID=4232 RepID=UPI000B90387D|nr:uncharacterized protein LOC110942885 [Helianthus annuus]